GLELRGGPDIADWLGTEDFDTAVLSCSSIAPDGSIWCNDGLEDFRSGILQKKDNDLIVLADSSKLKTAGSGGGTRVAKIEWSTKTWLFVDEIGENATDDKRMVFEEFKK